MKINSPILSRIASWPRPVQAIAGGFLVAVSLIYAVPRSPVHQKPTPAPVPAHRAAPVAPDHTKKIKTTLGPVATPVPTGPLLLPGSKKKPKHLTSGNTKITIKSSPGGRVSAAWLTLGSVVTPSRLASFALSPPASLRAVAPSKGLIRMEWKFWIRAHKSGRYTLVARVAGGDAKVKIDLDGSAAPTIAADRQCENYGRCDAAATSAGTIGLGPGWHTIQITATASARNAKKNPASITLYMRAPGASAPVAVIPSWPASGAKK